MSWIHAFNRTVTAEMTSANISAAMDYLCQRGIFLRDVWYRDDLTIQFRVSLKSYKRLHPILKKRGDSSRIISREGLFWKFQTMVHRPVLIFGLFIFLFLIIFVPGRVLFVAVEGNSVVSSNQILSVASDLGLKFGTSRRLVKSEAVKNGLLSAIEELEWVGVNTKGCVAVISVREQPGEELVSEPQGIGDVVAIRDGVVLSCDVTRGKALCIAGQAVKVGDILISGTMDQGFATVSTVADGEVFASTERKFSVLLHGVSIKRGASTSQKEKYSLLIGKKLINFFKGSGISGGTCVKMYSKYVLTLPGGFCLPVALVKYSFESGELAHEKMGKNQAQQLLSDISDRYVRDQMIAGQILNVGEEITSLGDSYRLTGTYACTEMIGRVQQEQIGAYHGKTD